MRESRFRACPLCEAICGLEIACEGGKPVAIRGDAADPFSRGHICPKGNAILDLEADPDRLRTPVRRVGDAWEPIAWDAAFALAGERLAAVQREHGPAAVATPKLTPQVAKTAPVVAPTPPATVRKLSFKEQKELEALPKRIESLDAEVAALTAKIQDPEFYRQGADAVNATNARLAAIELELAQAYVRWEALES